MRTWVARTPASRNNGPVTPRRFARQTTLPELGDEGQRRLGESTALIAGCGALGSHVAEILARSGIGRLILVDRDLVEESNLHRVALFTPQDVGRPKADAAAGHLGRIAPEVPVTPHVAHLGAGLAEDLVPQVDIVLDGLDNLETRYVVNDACVKHDTPWLYTAVLATHGMTMPVLPGKGPCLRCLFPSPPAPGAMPTCAEAGILGPVPAALAALEAAAAIRILAGGQESTEGRLVYIDLWTGRTEMTAVGRAPNCPCCGARRFEFLGHRISASILCGDSVQVVPERRAAVDLQELAVRLGSLGHAQVAHGVLVAEVEGTVMTVFADGRAVVKGVTDVRRAQALYDQYLAR